MSSAEWGGAAESAPLFAFGTKPRRGGPEAGSRLCACVAGSRGSSPSHDAVRGEPPLAVAVPELLGAARGFAAGPRGRVCEQTLL